MNTDQPDAVEIDLSHIAIYSRFVAWLDRKEKGTDPNAGAIDAFCLLSGKDNTSPTYYLFQGFTAGYAAALSEQKKKEQDAPRQTTQSEPPQMESKTPLPKASENAAPASEPEPLPKGQVDYFSLYRETQAGA